MLGRTVIEWALAPFIADGRCAGIVVALAPEDPVVAAGGRNACPARSPPSTGGDQRSASVLNALRALGSRADERDWVLVHDAARPCLPAPI